MSWLYSQALGEEYSAENSLDGEPYARLNVMPTPQQFLHNGKTINCSKPSLYGQTLRLLTEDHGAELLTWFLAVFPVKTSVQPEKEQESPEQKADSGNSLQGSFARFDRGSCSWKIAQFSLLGGLMSFLGTWPRWGSMRNGACWERPMLEPRINGTASGLLPTQIGERAYRVRPGKERILQSVTLGQQVKMIPTPCAQDAKNSTLPVSLRNRDSIPGFLIREMWPTPTCNMIRGGPNHNSPQVLAGRHGINLEGAVIRNLFHTPKVSDAADRKMYRNSRMEPQLAGQVKLYPRGELPSTQTQAQDVKEFLWPTPSSNGGTGGCTGLAGGSGNRQKLYDMLGEEEGKKMGCQSLNPNWVEWLMGWPLEWSALPQSETVKSRNALPKRGED